jgi:hypothetical protein
LRVNELSRKENSVSGSGKGDSAFLLPCLLVLGVNADNGGASSNLSAMISFSADVGFGVASRDAKKLVH